MKNASARPKLILTFLKTASLLVIGGLCSLASQSRAQQVISEDFEGGNLGNWTVGVSPTTPFTISSVGTNKIPTGGSYSARMTNSSSLMYTNFPVLTSESFKLTFYYYDNSGTANRFLPGPRRYA